MEMSRAAVIGLSTLRPKVQHVLALSQLHFIAQLTQFRIISYKCKLNARFYKIRDCINQ